MEELEALSYEERLNLLLPVESLFAGLPSLHLEDFYEQLCKNGCEIYQQKIGTSFPVGQRVRLLDRDNRFYALGEVREYPDGTAVKSIKKFIL